MGEHIEWRYAYDFVPGFDAARFIQCAAYMLKEDNGLYGKMFNICGAVEKEIEKVFALTEGKKRIIVCDIVVYLHEGLRARAILYAAFFRLEISRSAQNLPAVRKDGVALRRARNLSC